MGEIARPTESSRQAISGSADLPFLATAQAAGDNPVPAGEDGFASWPRNDVLKQYEAAFRENDVGADPLREPTNEDLEALATIALGHERRLLMVISKLRKVAASPLTASSTYGTSATRGLDG